MNVPRIVITGAPASAKTEFIERLKALPDFSHFTFFEEIARKLLIQDVEIRQDPESFHHYIYHFQIERENSVNGKPFITDRGTVDGFAFHPESLDLLGTTLEQEYRRYPSVIQLGSAACLGRKYYVRDEVRSESLSEALAVEKAIDKVWKGHDSYNYVEADYDIERKFDKFVRLIRQLVSR